MTSIHKFTGKASGYSKYRPHYPQEYIDYLISSNSLAEESVVADIGSGTGKFMELRKIQRWKATASI